MTRRFESKNPANGRKPEIAGLIGISTDITERKHAEKALRLSRERFRVAINALGAGFLMRDAQGKILESNTTFQELTGMSEQDLRNRNPESSPNWSLIHEDGTPFQVEELPSRISTLKGTPLRHIVMGVVRNSQLPLWLSINATPIRTEEEREGVVVTAFDITDRKQLEPELKDAIALREDFVSIASHELKTPISALSLNLQFLRKLILPYDSEGKLDKLTLAVLSAANSAQHLLSDLLDMTKIRSGQLELKLQTIELRTFTEECIEPLKEFALRSNSPITLLPGSQILGNWDPARLRQVLTNLLSNALKYGAGQPIVVSLESALRWEYLDSVLGSIFLSKSFAPTAGRSGSKVSSVGVQSLL